METLAQLEPEIISKRSLNTRLVSQATHHNPKPIAAFAGLWSGD
jgi:hypothetical protein